MTEPPDQDAPPQLTQIVTVQGGYAYATIYADIHVDGERSWPVYVLEDFVPPHPPEPEWLRELPSRMLNARHEVVEFTGRETELDELRVWRDTDAPVSARWLHGAGGQGKTRLANRLAVESLAADWRVVHAIQGSSDPLLTQGSLDLRLDGAVGLLLIVDYADRWPLTDLSLLFSNSLFTRAGVQTRILMLARTRAVWPAVRGALDRLQPRMSAQHLGPVSDGDEPRTHMFRAARGGFAARYGVRDPTAIEPPTALNDPEFGLTLALHVAALVAVDAHVAGVRPPADMAALTVYLLDRESKHWANLYENAANRAKTNEPTYSTPPEAMNRAVFTAVLTGATPRDTGVAVLDRLHPELDAAPVLDDHSLCYPAEAFPGTSPTSVLEPLYPDRLAEDFLALLLPGHDADYPPQDWAPTAATALLDQPDDVSRRLEISARSVAFLTASAERWRHVGTNCLYPALLRTPRAALSGGSSVLSSLAEIAPADVLVAVESAFPDSADFNLDLGIAAITLRLTPDRLAASSSVLERADLYANLGYRCWRGGLAEQAVAATREAVDLCRELAAGDRTMHLPHLALSLLNLGGMLAGSGRRQEGLTLTEEAIDAFRELANADPAAHAPRLAASLDNLGIMLTELGSQREALRHTQEAVDLRRQLAAVDPAEYQPELAVSLINLGHRLWIAGQPEQALSTAQEAVDAYRALVDIDSAAYLPDLAGSLNNLCIALSGFGRDAAALAAAQEATEIYRRLADVNPTVYETQLAMSLSNLGGRLSKSDHRAEALAAVQEATDLYRRLAEANPAAHEPQLAICLDGLGIALSDLGLRTEALTVTRESVDICRRLAEANPAEYLPNLGDALTSLGFRCAEVERRSDALAATREAVDIYRRLDGTDPAVFRPELARALGGFAQVRAQVGLELPDALAAAEETIELYRPLAEEAPAVFSGQARLGHATLAAVLDASGDAPAAAEVRRRLARPELC